MINRFVSILFCAHQEEVVLHLSMGGKRHLLHAPHHQTSIAGFLDLREPMDFQKPFIAFHGVKSLPLLDRSTPKSELSSHARR